MPPMSASGAAACALLLAVRATLSVANRVAYRIMLVPMHPFAYWLSVGISVVNVLFYGVLLLGRLLWGTPERFMDGAPVSRLLLIGWCDCVSCIFGLTSSASLSGPTIVALSQTVIPFLVVVSYVTSNRIPTPGQAAAAGLVGIGIVITVGDAIASTSTASDVPLVGMAVVGLAFSALSLDAREQVFRENPHLSVLGVTFLSGVFQVIFSVVLFPLVCLPALGGIPLDHLLGYHHAGWRCFLGAWLPDGVHPVAIAHHTTDCSMMPTPVALYCATTAAFSLVALLAAQTGRPSWGFTAGMLALAVQYVAFAWDWPLLPRVEYSHWEIIGFSLVLAGLIANHEASRRRQLQEAWETLRAPDAKRGYYGA